MHIQRTKKTTTRVRELYIIDEKLLTKAFEKINKKVFKGKIDKFLDRHRDNYRYERTYSVTIPHFSKIDTKGIDWLLVKCNWPNHVRDVLNIMKTLNEFYGLEVNRRNIKAAFIIWVSLYDKVMYPSFNRTYSVRYGQGKKDVKEIHLSPRQARKEFEARGFKKDLKGIINLDFAHVASVNNRYVWPANFRHGYIKSSEYITDIYVAQTWLGIAGYTKSVIPKKN